MPSFSRSRIRSAIVRLTQKGKSAGGRLFNRKRRFINDVRGTTAVEFALILVPFFGLLGATFDAAMLYFRSAQLQLTTEQASRDFLINNVEKYPNSDRSLLTYQQFVARYVCTWQSGDGTVKPGTLGKMFDCSQLLVKITPHSSWSQANTWDSMDVEDVVFPAQSGRFVAPTPDSITVVRVAYPVSSFFGFYRRYVTRIEGFDVFRVEPGG